MSTPDDDGELRALFVEFYERECRNSDFDVDAAWERFKASVLRWVRDGCPEGN